MQGQIYKLHSNFYTIKCDDKFYSCGARGVLKIKSDGLCVGDYVEFDGKAITKVFERKNRFIRPSVSNIDAVVIVVSPAPAPDFYLIDKLILNSVKEDVEIVILVNKTDVNDKIIDKIKSEYQALNVKILPICVYENKGVDQVKEILKGKLSVLAGQSAVGKTSLINLLFNLNNKTGELSDKIVRGKHTTTRSEIFEKEDIKLIDSPGFAVIDADVSKEEFPECYPEYLEVSNLCKFRGCTHTSEPQCKVKELVENGILSKDRYERYVEIYEQVSKRRIIYEKD